MKILNKKLVEEAYDKFDTGSWQCPISFQAGVDAAESQMKEAFDLLKIQLPKDVKFDDDFELGVHQTWGSRAIQCYDFCRFINDFLKERDEEA